MKRLRKYPIVYKMSASKELDVRKRIGDFYTKNKHLTKSEVLNHFKLENISRSTVYCVLNKVDKGIDLSRKVGSGQYQIINRKIKDKIIEENVSEIAKSYRSIGRKFNISDKTAKKVLEEANIKRLHRKMAPKSDERQKQRQRKSLQKLRRKVLFCDTQVVMDDESYFTLDGSDSNGNDHY
jgi:hypothetical protein